MENSSNGSVVQTLDLLADRNGDFADLSVCGEYYLTVHHSLLMQKRRNAGKGEINGHSLNRTRNVKVLYTHPQAWGQCEQFLQKHFHGIERQDCSSTSRAAEIVATSGESDMEDHDDGDDSCAAIASRFALTRYRNLEAVAENIEDIANNTTRFFILRNSQRVLDKNGSLPPGSIIDNDDDNAIAGVTESYPPPQNNARSRSRKSLITFTINHHLPGALADALLIFKQHHLNLTSINSRPSRTRLWQYVFFIECEDLQPLRQDEVDCHATTVAAVMHELRTLTECSRYLGSWWNQL